MSRLLAFWPLILPAAAAVLAWRLGLVQDFSLAGLARHQQVLTQFVADHPLVAALAYFVFYAGMVALALPGGAVLTCAGGLLFGVWLGGLLAVLGASTGAILLFLIARTAFGPLVARRADHLLKRIGPGLERDGFTYLLAARLLPGFPFWLVNVAPALVGMRLLPFATATALGILPATFVVAGVGAGLTAVLAAGRVPEVSLLLTPSVLAPLATLGVASLLLIAWRVWRIARA